MEYLFGNENKSISTNRVRISWKSVTGMRALVLKAVRGRVSISKTARDRKFVLLTSIECLNSLQKRMWVPRHHGIEGNKKADELSQKGSNSSFTVPHSGLLNQC